MIAIVVAQTLPPIVWIGFLTYNSLIVTHVLGGTALEAGILLATGSFTMAMTGSQAGRITTVFASRLGPLIGANICLGSGFGVVLFAPTISIALLGITILGSGFGILMSLYRSVITGLIPQSSRGGVVSLSEAGGRVTVTLTPTVLGWVIAINTSHTGLTMALRVGGLGAAVVGSGGGILCLLIAHRSSAVSTDPS